MVCLGYLGDSLLRNATLIWILLICGGLAVPKSDFFPYGPSAKHSTLQKRDEHSTHELHFDKPVRFYGVTYTSAYVNMNGFTSFGTEIPNFVNAEIPFGSYPLIAPFYADVDARGSGDIYYGSSRELEQLNRATSMIQQEFSDNTNFEAEYLFIVTWDKVGYYNGKSDKVNSFQAVLVAGGRTAYAIFMYASGEIQWIKGEGKSPYQKDARAQAGFQSDDGRYYTLAPSGTHEMTKIDRMSNIDVEGVWMFRISGATIRDPREVAVAESDDYEDYYDDDYYNEGRYGEPPMHNLDGNERLTDMDFSAQCPQNEEYKECGSSCAPSCAQPKPEVCTFDCVSGCFCNEGLYRHMGVCIPLEDCPVLPAEREMHDPDQSQADADAAQEHPAGPCPILHRGACSDPGCAIEIDTSGCQLCVCRAPEPVAPPDATNGPVCSLSDPQPSCSDTAQCVQYRDGGCCQCNPGFIGDGKECLKIDEPQRIGGRFSGRINDMDIPETDIHSYVVPEDGRAYIAISRVDPLIGRPLLLLHAVGGVMGWLFAHTPEGGVKNGFTLSGGHLNRSVTVHIGSSHTVTIRQEFSGKDIFQYLKATTFVTGTLPQVLEGTEIHFEDHTKEFRRVAPGIIKSYSTSTVRAGEQEYAVVVDDTIRFHECPFGIEERPAHDVVSLTVERTFVTFETEDNVVRYAGVNIMKSSQTEDPCREGAHTCTGPNMACAPDGGSFRCLCMDGYEFEGGSSLAEPGGNCRDIDECATSLHTCDQNADCINGQGSYQCQCKPGFRGTGTRCVEEVECGGQRCDENAECLTDVSGIMSCICKSGYQGDGTVCTAVALEGEQQTCEDVMCDPNANCVEERGYIRCVCRSGFHGNGQQCSRSEPLGPPCRSHEECSQYGACEYNEALGYYKCRCRQGFSGDGIHCQREAETCDVAHNCHPDAKCVLEDTELGPGYVCRCRAGFSGDGFRCSPLEVPEQVECSVLNNCHRNAQCVHNPQSNRYECHCQPGYQGDGYRCEAVSVPEPAPSSGCEILRNCHPDGQCVPDRNIGRYVCQCNPGFRGDGYRCEPEHSEHSDQGTECANQEDCHVNAACVMDDTDARFFCECLPGYKGDGVQSCIIADECVPNSSQGCDPHARCLYEQPERAYVCICDPGFVGDGKVCEPDQESLEPTPPSGCDVLRNCDPDGQCVPDRNIGRYVCQCNPGFTGDGYRCEPEHVEPEPAPSSSCEILRNCHPDGQCVPDRNIGRYVCQCNPGFRGDGYRCEPEHLEPDVPIGQEGCEILRNCHPEADCVYDQSSGRHTCRCRYGTTGDGYRCEREVTCAQMPELCSADADCIPSAGGFYECRCRDGFRGDGQQCERKAAPSPGKLYFAQGMAVFERSTVENKIGKQVLLVPRQIVVGLDYDCKTGDLYWTDIIGHALRTGESDGANVTEVLTQDAGLDSPEGVAVDWSSRLLYWTDSSADKIGVVSLDDNTQRKYIIQEGLVNPRAIILDVPNGKLYYSDWNRQAPVIGRADMDGGNGEDFVTEDILLANGLALLPRHQELCWADAGTQRLECIRLDGTSRRLVHAPLSYPFGLTVHNEETFYWTDWEDKRIHHISIYGQSLGSFPASVGGSGKLYGIVAHTDTCPWGESACANQNGGCEHLCLPKGRSRVCVCPDSMSEAQCNRVETS